MKKPVSAHKQYKDFTGAESTRITKITVPPYPKHWIYVGEADAIPYKVAKHGRKKMPYIHYLKKHGIILKSPNGKMYLIINVKTNMKKEGITG